MFHSWIVMVADRRPVWPEGGDIVRLLVYLLLTEALITKCFVEPRNLRSGDNCTFYFLQNRRYCFKILYFDKEKTTWLMESCNDAVWMDLCSNDWLSMNSPLLKSTRPHWQPCSGIWQLYYSLKCMRFNWQDVPQEWNKCPAEVPQHCVRHLTLCCFLASFRLYGDPSATVCYHGYVAFRECPSQLKVWPTITKHTLSNLLKLSWLFSSLDTHIPHSLVKGRGKEKRPVAKTTSAKYTD